MNLLAEANLVLHLKRDGIIWASDTVMAFRKRGSMVIKSIERDKAACGFVGSDRLKEDGYAGFSETIEPVVNELGQPLRFGLIAIDALKVKAKLVSNQPLKIATTYPLTAARCLNLSAENIEYFPGSIEAELVDNQQEFDCGFELIQSGDSVRQNGLTVVEDDIEQVTLQSIYTPYDW